MSDFKPIETQEQLDSIIKDRVARAEKSATEKVEEKYKGYISPDDFAARTKELNEKNTELGNSLKNAEEERDKAKNDLTGLESKVKAYETASVKSRIAHELGIPYELANKLSGETEDEIRKDAEAMKPFISKKGTAPLRDPESGDSGSGSETRDSMKKLVEKMKE